MDFSKDRAVENDNLRRRTRAPRALARFPLFPHQCKPPSPLLPAPAFLADFRAWRRFATVCNRQGAGAISGATLEKFYS